MEHHPDTRYLSTQDSDLVPITFAFQPSVPPPPPVPTKDTGLEHFSASRVYGVDWINQHSERYALWVRDRFVDFALTLAGKLFPNASVEDSLKRVVRTGFEDLQRMEHRAGPRTSDFAHPQQPIDVDADLESIDPSLGLFEKQTGNTDAGFRLYQYFTLRRERNQEALSAWLTLPMNLTTLYFQPSVKDGIESALDRVGKHFPYIDGDKLLGLLLNSAAYSSFAALVVRSINYNTYFGRSGEKTQHELRSLTTELHRLELAIAQVDLLKPSNRPPDAVLSALKQQGRASSPKRIVKTEPLY